MNEASKKNSHSAEELGAVHEMVHSAYRAVYKNDMKPFGKEDLTLEREYQGILADFKKIADYFSTISRGDHCQNEKHQQKHIMKFYAPEFWSQESIAYYAQNSYDKPNNGCIDAAFPGYKGFVQKHNIPDFIKFIEQHPRCNEISYSDETIITPDEL